MLMLVILVLFPFVIWQAYRKLRRAKESPTWPTTAGSVTQAERIKLGWRTQPRVSFNYQVDGKTYTSTRISFADAVPASETDPILSRYRLHQPVTVHYQPKDPAFAVLEPGPNLHLTKAFRRYLILFSLIIFVNVFNIALAVWQASHDSKGTPVRTYDDLAKADPQLGNRLIREGAEKGDVKDQGYVAFWYLTGTEGYPKDPAEGAKWLRKAADQGDADAQNRLGQLYASGTGVEKNLEEAVKWLKKAAARGEPHACFSLGYASERGVGGMPLDTQKAIEWYRKAGDDPKAKAAIARLNAVQ